MESSPNLNLPYIAPSQAQKHVTHNEAIARLDALVQLTVVSASLSEPPSDPAIGDRFIVASGASGEWSGNESKVAIWQNGIWEFHSPKSGLIAWNSEIQKQLVWNGTDWADAVVIEELPELKTGMLGINTDPDTHNRIVAKTESVLFSHDDVSPGSGNIHQSLNKNSSADSCSLIFQTGYSARSEIGLTGDDSFHVRISADGSSFQDAIVVDGISGNVGLGTSSPSTALHVEGPVRIATFTVSTLPNASDAGAGSLVVVSDTWNGPTIAYSDGSDWRRANNNNII